MAWPRRFSIRARVSGRRVSVGGAPSIQISGTGTTRTITISNATTGNWSYFDPAHGMSSATDGVALLRGETAFNLQSKLRGVAGDTTGVNMDITVAGAAGGPWTITYPSGDPGAVTVSSVSLA